MVDEKVRYGENVYAVKTTHLKTCRLVHPSGIYLPPSCCTCGAMTAKFSKEIIVGKNIVTDAGDVYYAELGAGESPTNFAAPDMALTTAQNAPSRTTDFSDLTTIPTGGTQDIDATYPMTNDSDANNPGTTGTDIVTWRRSWVTANANGTIIGIAIFQSAASGTDPLLMHAAFGASFVKTSADTLATYVNHRFNGV